MTDTLKRYATPLITGLFLVSLISGIALFFHVGGAAFHGMHEWLSMVLIIPLVLHLWRNWRAMLGYLGRTPFTIAIVVSLVAALSFAVPAMTGSSGRVGGPPQLALSRVVLANPPSKVAALLGQSADQLVTTLKAQGFTAAAAEIPLADIASKSGKGDFELVTALLAATP